MTLIALNASLYVSRIPASPVRTGQTEQTNLSVPAFHREHILSSSKKSTSVSRSLHSSSPSVRIRYPFSNGTITHSLIPAVSLILSNKVRPRNLIPFQSCSSGTYRFLKLITTAENQSCSTSIPKSRPRSSIRISSL